MNTDSQKRFACHRLVNVYGQMLGASVIVISSFDHTVGNVYPFGQEEEPFTQWLSGTILLSQAENQPLQQGQCINDYLMRMKQDLTGVQHSSLSVYAWHTPILDLHTPLTSPLLLLK